MAGFEDEVGNGPIYKQLRNAFMESGESLPDWFVNHSDGNADEAKRTQQLKEREQRRRPEDDKTCHSREQGEENKVVDLVVVVVEVAIGAAIGVVVVVAAVVVAVVAVRVRREGEDTNAAND